MASSVRPISQRHRDDLFPGGRAARRRRGLTRGQTSESRVGMMSARPGRLRTPASIAAGTHDFLKKPDPWFATDEARAIAANILSYQSDYGGWPKNMDLTAAPFSGQPVDLVGDLKPIFDNGATTDEVRFMARMF